ncbi:MAG: Holliday junction branch migration protein RuvA [Patescibacteria group bacterium]
MIGKIIGVLASVEGNVGLIETSGGVSYEVYLTPNLLSKKIGSMMDIRSYLQVRDDAFVLFGFESVDQHHFFKLLLSVSGVGPKTAFNVVSHTRVNELLQAVKENDVEYFTQVPGLGKKTSMKIILELSQKVKSEFKFNQMNMSDDDKTVIEALVALGYKTQEAKNLFSKLPKDLSIEEKIKHALKLTVQKK